MKSNPFYALSASAMLLGCWLLSEALHLQAGQLGGLLTLMAVLQLYEGLLVGLGTRLVRSGRAPRDGVSVLVLESIFLVDAPLLAAECVTADARVGTMVALVLAALAAAKLAWVRRAAPGVLSEPAALLLGAQAVFVLALPVAAAHLAWARAFGPLALYAMGWTTLALPLAQRWLLEETRPQVPAAAARAHGVWTWVPAAMVLVHLWAVGYIHAIDFRPAFLAPFFLGLAVASRRGQVVRQVAVPGIAVLLSVGQAGALGFRLPGAQGVLVSPLVLALAGVALAWAYLAWRDRERWLVVLALGSAAAGALGTSAIRLSELIGRLLRLVEFALPRDAFGGGLLAVIAAFVLLGAGARRSLKRPGPPPASPSPLAGRRHPGWRESAATALCLGVFAFAATAHAHEASAAGRAAPGGPLALALLAAGWASSPRWCGERYFIRARSASAARWPKAGQYGPATTRSKAARASSLRPL
jgi:hypothetical protein